MDTLTKVYVSLEAGERHLVLDGDLALLERFLRAIGRQPKDGLPTSEPEAEARPEGVTHD